MVLSHLLSIAFGFAAAGFGAEAFGAFALTVALASARMLCLLPALLPGLLRAAADFELFAPPDFFAAPALAREPLPALLLLAFLPALLPADVRDFALVVFDFARGAWSFLPC